MQCLMNGMSVHPSEKIHCEVIMPKHYFFIFMLIIAFLTGAETVIADNASEKAALEARIDANENLILQKQAEIDNDELSITETRKIYTLGLDKHKELADVVKDIEKKHRTLASNIFVMKISYKEFLDAYLAYREARRRPLDYPAMDREYKKMYHYINGFDKTPPWQDPYLAYYDIQGWGIKKGASWTIRSLAKITSAILIAKKVIDVKDAITGAISTANDGFRAVFDYCAGQGIDTIEESAIDALKEAGSNSSTVIEQTLILADVVSDPLASVGLLNDELQRMKQRIEKREAFGYPTKEEAIAKMRELQTSLEEAHQNAEQDADAVKTALQPVKTQLDTYEGDIAALREEQRQAEAQIKADRARIAELDRLSNVEDSAQAVAAYQGTSEFYSLGVNTPWGVDSLSKDQLTAALTGYPTEIIVEGYRTVYGVQPQLSGEPPVPETVTCDGQTHELRIPAQVSVYIDGNSVLTATSSILNLNGDKLVPVAAGTGSVTFSTAGEQFDEYRSSRVCNTDIWSAYGTGNNVTPVSKDFTVYQVDQSAGIYLAPQGIQFSDYYYLFKNKSKTPYNDLTFHIYYKLVGEANYRYKAVDKLTVTASGVTVHPDGYVSGKYILEGFVKALNDSSYISMASMTLQAESIAPTMSFIDHENNPVTVSEGIVPLNKPVTLALSESTTPDNDTQIEYQKFTLASNGNFREYQQPGYKPVEVTFEGFHDVGSPIPVDYYIRMPFYTLNEHIFGTFGDNFIGGIWVDDFYMTEPGQNGRYLSPKNLFYFGDPANTPDLSYEIHAEAASGPDMVINSFSEDIEKILFDHRYIVGINEMVEDAPENTYEFYANEAIKTLGGQMVTGRRKIYAPEGGSGDNDEDDMGVLEENGLFLTSNENEFVGGFYYNVVKLRMRDQDRHRYFVLKILGATAMDTHYVRWTFMDNDTRDGTFDQNGLTWEAITPADKQLAKVELFSRDHIKLGEIVMADLVTTDPQKEGIFEDQFTLRLRERFEQQAGVYQRVAKVLQFRPNDRYTLAKDFSLPVAPDGMQLIEAAGVKMLPIEDVTVDNDTVSFTIGISLPTGIQLKILQAPVVGTVDIQSQTISYTAPPGFTGTAGFSIDLYGAISHPYVQNGGILRAMEERYIEVTVDYSGSAPVVSVDGVYSCPEIIFQKYRYGDLNDSMTFDAVITSAVTADPDTSATIIIADNDETVIQYNPVYFTSLTDFSDNDVLTLNNNYPIQVTSYHRTVGSWNRPIAPGERVVFSREYIQSLFYHLYAGTIDTVYIGTQKYNAGFDYTVLKDGQEVGYISGGYPMDSFDSVEVSYNPPGNIADPAPAALALRGTFSGTSYEQYRYFTPPDLLLPEISVSPTSISVSSGSCSPQTLYPLTITNNGLADLIVGNIYISGSNPSYFMVTTDTCSGQSVAPGENCTVEVSYQLFEDGTKTAELMIPSNDPEPQVMQVSMSGTADCSYLQDSDGDGIHDDIDGLWDGTTFYNHIFMYSNDFTDLHLGGVTSGSIINRNDMTIAVVDANAGVWVSADGSPSAAGELNICAYDIRALNGDSFIVTCASADIPGSGITVRSIAGTVRVYLSTNKYVDIPASGEAQIVETAPNTFVVRNSSPATDITITGDGEVVTVHPGETVDVLFNTFPWEMFMPAILSGGL